MRLAMMPRLPSSLLEIPDDDPAAVPLSLEILKAADFFEDLEAQRGVMDSTGIDRALGLLITFVRQTRGR